MIQILCVYILVGKMLCVYMLVGKMLCVYMLVEKMLRGTDAAYRCRVIQRTCGVYTVGSGKLVRLDCSSNQGSRMISLKKNVQAHHFDRKYGTK